MTLFCSCDTLVLTSYWLSAQQNTLINLGPTKQGGMQLLVLVPYNETQEVRVMQGALMGYEHVTLPSIAPLQLRFTTTRVMPVFEDIHQTDNVITASITFSRAMSFDGLSSSWLLVQDSSSVLVDLSLDTLFRLHLQITFVVPGSVNITFKSGVCYSISTGEYNLASDMIEVSYAEALFSFTSSFEDRQEVTSPDIELSLYASDLVMSIWPANFEVENCKIAQFSQDIVEGATVVVLGIHVLQPGEFSITLPARSVQLLTGEFNDRWSIVAVFVEGCSLVGRADCVDTVEASVVMSDLLGKPALNIPLLVDIQFSKKVDHLDASCFDLVNINNLNIIGFNPYFVVHAFPHDEGVCSIQLKESTRCLDRSELF